MGGAPAEEGPPPSYGEEPGENQAEDVGGM